MKTSQFSLPIGYIVTSVPCTYKKIDAKTTSGSCAASGKVTAYARPDRNSEKILEASLLWAHLEGRPVQSNKLNPAEKSKDIVWFNKKDIPYKIGRLNQDDRIKTLIEFLNTASGSPSNENRNLAENLKFLSEQPLDLDLDSAGETKWTDGILWVKVSVRSEPKTKKKVLGWYSRGC